jgi:hypothetical protein
MEQQGQEELCEACGGRRASHFVCQPGHGPAQRLCKECYEESLSGPMKDFVDTMRKARCRFCGGAAMATDSMTTVLDGIGAEPRFLCSSCSHEYNLRMLARLNEAEDLNEVPAAAQVQYLRQLAGEVDLHMRRWVQQRDN